MKLIEQLGRIGHVLGYEQAISLLAEVGFDGLDISLFDEMQIEWLQEKDCLLRAKALREHAASCGIDFLQAHAPFRFTYEEEKNYREAILPLVQRSFYFAGEMGVRDIVVHPLHHIRYYGNEQFLFDWNLDYYSALAETARDAGVTVAVENMWQRDPNRGCIVPSFCGQSSEHARFMDALAGGPFTACVDLGHAALVGEEPQDFLMKLGKRTGCLHVQDTDYKQDMHTMPGFGKHDWPAICQALAKCGYKGDLTFEFGRVYGQFADETCLALLAQLAHAKGRYLIRLIEQNK